MSPELRAAIYDIARWCGGFVIKQDGVVISRWEWDYENDKPRRVG